MTLSRRKFLSALATVPTVGVLAVGYMRFFEPFWFEVTEKTFRLRKLFQLSDYI